MLGMTLGLPQDELLPVYRAVPFLLQVPVQTGNEASSPSLALQFNLLPKIAVLSFLPNFPR